MGTSLEPVPISLKNGFWPSSSEVGMEEIRDAVVDGINFLWLGDGLHRSAKGLGAGPGGVVQGERLYLCDRFVATVKGKGSIIAYRGGTFFYVSVESTAGEFSISDSSQMNGTGGVPRYRTGTGTELNIGLVAPPKATIGPGGAGSVNSAATAVQITRIRTGQLVEGDLSMDAAEESLPSPNSNVAAITNKNIAIEFPQAGTGLDQHDAWGIYITKANAGSLAPGLFLRLKTVLESEVAAAPARTLEFSYAESDLEQLLPPTDAQPPQHAQFIASLGNVIILIGTRGGTYFSASKPGFFGSYPPLAEGLLPSGQAVNGILTRPGDSRLFMWTDSSLGTLSLSGSPLQPIYPRNIWPNLGIPSKNGLNFADDRLYAFTSEASPTMIMQNGEPDTTFAIPVRQWIMDQGWTAADVGVGYDPRYDAAVFCHHDQALVWMQSLKIWCVPINLNGTGASYNACLTFNGHLIISRDGGAAGVYTWEAGTGMAWHIVTARQDKPNPDEVKTFHGVRIHCKMSGLTIKIYFDSADTNGAPSVPLVNDPLTGSHYTSWDPLYNEGAKNWQIRLEGLTGGDQINSIETLALYTEGITDNA